MEKLIILMFIFFLPLISIGQGSNWKVLGNTGTNPSTNFWGTNDNAGLSIRTFGQQRMFINNNTGPTAGFIGIGNAFSAPQTPLQVVGSGVFSSLGWTKAISISNSGTLAWMKNVGADNVHFMGAPSGSLVGDFYAGTILA